MRSVMAPALLSRAIGSDAVLPPDRHPMRALLSPVIRRMLTVAAVGELIADKLPSTPDRTDVPSLSARALSGAFAAAAFASSRREPALPSAMLGATAALGSAHALMRLRKAAGRRPRVPDPFVGLAEDCVAFGLGMAVMRGAAGKSQR
jgi:uncharacterized membrane protein